MMSRCLMGQNNCGIPILIFNITSICSFSIFYFQWVRILKPNTCIHIHCNFPYLPYSLFPQDVLLASRLAKAKKAEQRTNQMPMYPARIWYKSVLANQTSLNTDCLHSFLPFPSPFGLLLSNSPILVLFLFLLFLLERSGVEHLVLF